MVRRKKSTFLHRLGLILGLASSPQRMQRHRTMKNNNAHPPPPPSSHRCSRVICLRIENDEELKMLQQFFPPDRWIETEAEHRRRLKALEFIRLFLEMTEEEFLDHLIHHEHLCQEKVAAIYRMIETFLQTIYSTENKT